jgi:hypothetical protein
MFYFVEISKHFRMVHMRMVIIPPYGYRSAGDAADVEASWAIWVCTCPQQQRETLQNKLLWNTSSQKPTIGHHFKPLQSISYLHKFVCG